jgi:DNA-binding SARP family transcriptional activator
VHLSLLDGFELNCHDEPVLVPIPAQRLLAFLALQNRPVRRISLAGQLWLDSTNERASGSLRSALWRLRQSEYEFVQASSHQLRLAPQVAVDVHDAVACAHRLLDASTDLDECDVHTALVSGELLPDWYEDWVLIEREQFRQLRARALEVLCGRLTVARRFAQAMQAGLLAVKVEPLRESAHRALIKVHLAEGNRADALRQYHLYRQLVHDQLALEPSSQMQELIRG